MTRFNDPKHWEGRARDREIDYRQIKRDGETVIEGVIRLFVSHVLPLFAFGEDPRG